MTSLVIINVLHELVLVIILSAVLALLACCFIELTARVTHNIIHRIKINRKQNQNDIV
jgi:hypothetical protein